MDIESLRRYCLSFPHATENLQWGDDLCFKVGGKIFAVVALQAVPQKISLKCTPETFVELIEREDIIPARYVGRYKWVLLQRLDAVRKSELEDLIRQSYEMVVAKAKPASHQAKAAKKNKKKRKYP